jgi:hypothetical protein
MKEQKVDMFTLHPAVHICITTNGMVTSRGENVMGAGTAGAVRSHIPQLPRLLGERLMRHGNRVFYWPEFKLFTFPTMQVPGRADWPLIMRSTRQLVDVCDACNLTNIYLPRPGCGVGGLRWSVVKEAIEPHLDDRFTACWID